MKLLAQAPGRMPHNSYISAETGGMPDSTDGIEAFYTCTHSQEFLTATSPIQP